MEIDNEPAKRMEHGVEINPSVKVRTENIPVKNNHTCT